MLLMRPVRMDDLPQLVNLAAKAGIGMTSLSSDADLLGEKILFSEHSFACHPDPEKPQEALYFFVAEDLQTGELAGTSAIKSQIGLKDPFYSYRLDKIVHASPQLGVHKVMPTLYLSNDYTGSAELASLLLAPRYRHAGHGGLLSKSRFLFLAQHLSRFPERLIADMRGVSDAQGRSPFWDALGRHFFSMDFPLADRLSGGRSKSFIAELMPRHPIYVPLLPESAQAVIAEVHPATQVARQLLEAEGFRHQSYVDIFDAGPTLQAETREVRAIKRARPYNVKPASVDDSAAYYLLANSAWQGFRCLQTRASVQRGELLASSESLEALQLKQGDAVWALQMDPKTRERV